MALASSPLLGSACIPFYKCDIKPDEPFEMQVVVLEDVSKAYGRRVIYDRLNLIVRRGERWCVMGKNGAGKSTLLKMVAGQVAPDRGGVRLGASLKVGYFAQQSLDLLDCPTHRHGRRGWARGADARS